MTDWGILIDLGIVGIALLLATWVRARVSLLQRFLIPNPIVAGFILLLFYNLIAGGLGLGRDAAPIEQATRELVSEAGGRVPVDPTAVVDAAEQVAGTVFDDPQAGLRSLVFHLLNLTMVAMGLRAPTDRSQKVTRPVLSTATVILSQFTLQSLVGFGLTFLFIALPFLPVLFPSYGYLVALGYSLGPGQAFSIGSGWEQFGFAGAGGLGLIFGAAGFLIACFGGVVFINYGVRRGLTTVTRAELEQRTHSSGLRGREQRPSGMSLTTRSEAIDSLTLNLGAVLGVYVLTFVFMLGLTTLLSEYGGAQGARLASNFWGISFIFGLLLALAARRVLVALGWDHYLDSGALTRISGGSVDLMVASALGAISLALVSANWLPVAVFATVVALVSFVSILWLTSRLFPGDYAFERAVLHWGTLTGTLSTGLALLRVLDPELKTPAAPNYVYANAVTFFALLPLFINMDQPTQAAMCDCDGPLYTALLVKIVYLAVAAAAFVWLRRRGSTAASGRLWARPVAGGS